MSCIARRIQMLRRFVPTQQLDTIVELMHGQEGEFFQDKIVELSELIEHYMPRTHETEGEGDNAFVYLHYFKGAGDWYVTERDVEPVQHQAFGYANPLGDPACAEKGYISIVELIQNGIELDLHWKPCQLHTITRPKPTPPPEEPPIKIDTLRFYEDPRHGWLRVPVELLGKLGIKDQITYFSYQANGFAYLEEDCDLTTFVNAIGDERWNRIKDQIETTRTNGDSVVRGFPSYTNDND